MPVFKDANPNVLAAYGFTFFNWAAQSILFQQILSCYVFEVSHSTKAVGFVKGIQGISQLVFSLPAGYISDKSRRDSMLRLSGILGILTSSFTFFVIFHPSLTYLYISFACWGIFSAIQNPAMEAIFADSIPHGKRSFPFMIKYNISNIAMMCGPLCSILLFYILGDVWKIGQLSNVLLFGTVAALLSCTFLFRFSDDYALLNEFDSEEERAPSIQRSSIDSPYIKTPTFEIGSVEMEYEYEPSVHSKAIDNKSTSLKHSNAHTSETAHLLYSSNALQKIQEPTFLCLSSRHVAIIIFLSDFIISNGAGMTINFFPLFFKNEYHLSPIQVNWVFFCLPIIVVILSYLSQRWSRKIGRTKIILATRLFSVVCLVAMSYAKPLALQIVLFLLRGGMMRCTQPLRRALLMDYVPKESRARWNALESISVFSWSGSAVLGGYLIDAFDYRTCFFITSIVYSAGLALELLLLPLTMHNRER